MEQVRLVLVDDHPVVIEGLKFTLNKFDWIEIVDVATNGKEAIEKSQSTEPLLVLLDVALPDFNGVKVAEEILKNNSSHVSIIAYTMYNDAEYLKLLIKAGVKGFLLKESSVDELIGAIETVAKGGSYFSPRATGNLLVELFKSEQKGTGLNTDKEEIESSQEVDIEILTNREKEILILIAQGEKNKGIAEQLGLNSRTVETHRRNLMMKLGIHSAAGLTRFAIENKMVSL